MEWIAAGLKRLSKGKHENCIGEDCSTCQWFDGDEHGRGKCAFSESFCLYNFAKENDMLHALVGPGSCFALYHGPEHVSLRDASPKERELFLEMLISERNSWYDPDNILGKLINQEGTGYLDEYGTAETLQFLIDGYSTQDYMDWIRRAVAKFPLSDYTLKAISGDCTILPHVYDLLAPMGDRLYEHCSSRGFKNLRELGHPNPELYVRGLLKKVNKDNETYYFPRAKKQPTEEAALEFFERARKDPIRAEQLAEIREASVGLDEAKLFTYGEEFGLQWLVVSSEGQEYLASKICHADLETMPERLASCSPQQRLYRMVLAGFVALKNGLQPLKARL